MLCENISGNMSRIRDLIDVLGLPHLYEVFIKEFIYLQQISGSFALLSTFSWGGANAATPHYPTVQLRIQDCPGVSPRNLGSWISRIKNDSDDSGT